MLALTSLNLPLGLAGVLLLHHPGHGAVPVAHDPAVSLRFLRPAGEQRHVGAFLRAHQLLQRLRADQRHVGGEHQHVAVEPAQRFLGAEHGMPRPQLLRLDHEAQRRAGELPRQRFGDLLGLVADHHHHR